MTPKELPKSGGLFQGLGKVFSFTLIQILKSKANLATLVLMTLMAAAAVPLYSLTGSSPVVSTFPAQQEEESEMESGDDFSYLYPDYEVLTVDEYLNASEDADVPESSADGELDEVGYGVQTGFSILIMIVATFSATYIIRSVTEEKISKLVELLMVSISPFTLIFGKILAVLTFILIQLALIGLGFLLSYNITGHFMDLSTLAASVESLLSAFSNVSPLTLIMLVFSLILSIFAFALLSGLAGAGCSSMDDTGNAMGIPMTIVMGCYLISIMSAFMNPTLRTVFSVLPFLSGFVGPSQYLLGNLSLPLLLLGFAVQLAVIAALVYICGKVYRDLLVYSGSQIKLGAIFKMAFKGHSRKEAV